MEIKPEIPANQEAEEAVIGSLLIDPNAIIEVSPILKPDDFYVVKHRWVYEAILAIYAEQNPIDLITLVSKLRQNGKLDELGGEAFVVSLLNLVPNSFNVMAYAQEVQAQATRRRMIRAAGQVAEIAYNRQSDIATALDQAEQIMLSVAAEAPGKGTAHISQVASSYLDMYNSEEDNRLSTGFTDLDRLIRVEPSDLVILAARPGMGKTSLQNAIALHAALRTNKNVLFFNLEMSGEQLVQRMVASQTGIDISRLRDKKLNEEELRLFMESLGRLSNAGIFIDDTPLLTPALLRNKARQVAAMHGLDLIIVDYLQLMSTANGRLSRTEQMTEISRQLKTLARELDVPVLAASQLSRAVEQRSDKRPQLSDLRDSGSIEQDADIVMFIYRDEYYNPDTTDTPNTAEIIVSKQRQGPTGTIDLFWHSKLAAFRNLQRNPIEF